MAKSPSGDKVAVDTGVSDAPVFADWLIENYTPYRTQFGVDVLPKGKWRKDYSHKVYDTKELYLIFKGSR